MGKNYLFSFSFFLILYNVFYADYNHLFDRLGDDESSYFFTIVSTLLNNDICNDIDHLMQLQMTIVWH